MLRLAAIVVLLNGFLAIAAPLGAQQRVGSELTLSGSVAAFPRVAKLPGGGFVAVWDGSDDGGTTSGVYVRRFDASGTPLAAPFLVNVSIANDQGNADVATDASGEFVVVWESFGQDGDDYGIFARRFDALGAPASGEFQVNTTTADRQDYPRVASDPSGNFFVVWQSNGQDGSDFGIVGRRYAAAGTPLGGEMSINTATAGRQVGGLVAVDATGDAVVAWDDFAGLDGSDSGVFARRYDATGAPLGGQFQVNVATAGFQVSRNVAIDAAGNFVVVWEDGNALDGAGSGTFLRRYDAAGTALGGDLLVNQFFQDSQGVGDADFDAAGTLVVVWMSTNQNGDGSSIYGRRYDAAGAPLGAEFLVNTTTTGDAGFPAVAMTGAGWVTVWHELTARGIVGQLMSDGTATDVCAPTPRPCRTPAVAEKASVYLNDKTGASKDGFQWAWKAGAATTKAEFGDPDGTDDYLLCVYGGNVLRATMHLPAGGVCSGRACWSENSKGFAYKNKALTPNGIAQLKLKEGIDGKAQIQVKGRGTNVPLPPIPSLASPLVVQLANDGTGMCWAAQYTFPPAQKLTSVQLKDKAD